MDAIGILLEMTERLRDEKSYLTKDVKRHEERAKQCREEIEKKEAEIKEIENDIAVLKAYKNKNRKEDIEK